MTHTTTDAAEARARKVLAQKFEDAGIHGYARHLVKNGSCDWFWTKPAVAAILAFATAEAASGAGEREVERCARKVLAETVGKMEPKFTGTVSDILKGNEVAVSAYEAVAAMIAFAAPAPSSVPCDDLKEVAAYLPPATDPAMVTPADWVNSIAGVKPTDQFIALDRRLFEDCIARALAAAPTIPATGEGA